MSATPNNAGAGWSGPPTPLETPKSSQRGEGGQNALQALLAFACIHEQAARRRNRESGRSALDWLQLTADEQFALDEVLHLVAERAVSVTGADGVAIALAGNDAIVCRASSGRIAPDAGVKLDSNAGFSGACLRSGHTVRCDDSETDSRVNPEACRILGARSMIAVPLSARGRIAGLIEAFSTEPYGFNDSDLRSLTLLGELILAAIRPEEEDRLARMAAQIVVPAAEPGTPPDLALNAAAAKSAPTVSPTAPKALHSAAATAPAPQRSAPAIVPEPVVRVSGPAADMAVSGAHPRIIVDEKFAPPLEAEAADKPKLENKAVAVETEAGWQKAEAAAQKEDAASAARETAPTADTPRIDEPRITPQVERDRRPLAAIATVALILVAIGLAWAIWVNFRRGEQAISANTQSVVNVKTGDSEREIILPAPAEVKAGPAPQVTGLRQWSSGDSSTVVVDVQDQVQYEAHSLDHPARLYFDLHDTKIAPELTDRLIDVNGPILKRVRMAQPVPGITRVVLETSEQADFSVSLDPNPYRLTIEVHKASAMTAAASAVPAPAKPVLPKPSPVIASPGKNGSQPLATKGFQIAIDAGHGGWDLGTVGKKGLLEKDLTLDIVQRLGKLVEEKLDAQVIYTRQDDSYVPLEKRAEIANLSGADLFVSVHANYSDLSTARGVETYYSNSYSSIKARTAEDDAALSQVNWTAVDIRAKVTDSHKLAADIQQALCGALVATNPDLRNRGVKEAQYVVLTGTEMPAVLAEVSFVSSPEDEAHLQSSDYRQRIAEALYRGLAKYREEAKPRNTKLASAKKPAH